MIMIICAILNEFFKAIETVCSMLRPSARGNFAIFSHAEKMRLGKIPVGFFKQRGYFSIQQIEPSNQDFRLFRKVHPGSSGLGCHELHPETLL